MYLSYAIFIPIIWGLLTMLLGSDRRAHFTKCFAFFGASVSFILSLNVVYQFVASTQLVSQMGAKKIQIFHLQEYIEWMQDWKIHYHLGIDGMSALLIALTGFVTFLIILAGWRVIQHKIAYYHGLFLILCGLTIGAFSALDGMLFYVFFEATLIPMYLVIGIWGGKRRVYAALKFFLYTLFGSLFGLLALIYLRQQSMSFLITDWFHLKLDMSAQLYIFAAFFITFAVKIPMWPVHTWLPDAHVEAPTGGSILLAALMLKLGTYGFFRFILPIVPDAARAAMPYMITLSLIAVIYIGLVAIAQTDMKKLVAYSSIAHMGFVTLGVFSFNIAGLSGAAIQMISHGFISAGMFFCIGVLYDRVHSREIDQYAGVAHVMPKFATFALVFAMANCGLPITSGFVGEVLVLLGMIEHGFIYTALAGLTLILSAAYSLWMYKRIFFGEIEHAHVKSLQDINARESFILIALLLMVFVMGIYPEPWLDIMQPGLDYLLHYAQSSKL